MSVFLLDSPPENAVHLWHGSLSRSPEELDGFAATLSADEQARAARLICPMRRRRFVVARGLLRRLLAGYVGGCSPGTLRFRYGPYGRPELGPLPDAPLRFNLSHCGDRAVYAVTRSRSVGVDLQEIMPLPEGGAGERLLRFCLAEGERARLERLPPANRAAAFARLWARKEAFVKARGLGLSVPLARLEFDSTLPSFYVDDGDGGKWIVTDLPLPNTGNAVAALCLQGTSLAPVTLHPFRDADVGSGPAVPGHKT